MLSESNFFPFYYMEKPDLQLLSPLVTCPTRSPTNHVPVAPEGIRGKFQL